MHADLATDAVIRQPITINIRSEFPTSPTFRKRCERFCVLNDFVEASKQAKPFAFNTVMENVSSYSQILLLRLFVFHQASGLKRGHEKQK